jgi:membrane-associated protease RseP (regulator of RpoE activity)
MQRPTQDGVVWQPMHQPAQSGMVWQPMQRQMQNGVTWQPAMQWPLGAQFVWQANASPMNVWSVAAATHSNPLGVEVAPADAALRAQLGLEEATGVVATSVPPDSEAEKSGLRAHDLILQIGEKAIESPEAFNEAVTSEVGKDAKFQIVRQGKRLTLPIKVPQTRMYDLNVGGERFTFQEHWGERYRLGLVLAEADPTLRSHLQIEDGKGLVVTQVLPDTPAAEADLREHDILIELDGKPLTAVEELNAQVQEIKDRKVGVTLLRGGERMHVELSPQLESKEETAKYGLRQPMQAWPQWYSFDSANSSFRPAPLEWFRGTDSPAIQGNGPEAGASDQVAALREQLASMQQTLEKLEAALKPADEPQQNDDDAEQDE